ncbi:AAA family ATPase [Pseudogemmobacter bohemicus]|uniref:AAA family ATPase n=1 Tax=Pseudogemmobacter bohemicus TaxID=2250708 RepID=UPI000DD3A1E8|nr:hypothetical protein [Pseudogemmobacter bohemicus]
MLSEPPPPEDEGPMRICAICDGFDALLRMSAWLVHVPANAIRTDLGLTEALDLLHQPALQDFDQIILAPDTGKTAAPKLVTGVLQAAAGTGRNLVLLLPPGSRLTLPQIPGMQIHYGPPFAAPEPVPDHPADGNAASAGEAARQDQKPSTPAKGLLTRLLRRGPAQPVAQNGVLFAPELPQQPCRILAFQPVAGGTGATTLAVNLAVELSRLPDPPEICLIDLNLQFGNSGTYLDLPANSRVTDAYRQLGALDFDSFQSCLLRVSDHLRIFAAPAEILPIDGMSDRDLRRILSLARDHADLVLLDLPHLITDWSGTAWAEADAVFTISRSDVRSAQNMVRLLALLRAERLAEGRLFHLLNMVPPRPDAAFTASRNGFEAGIGAAFFRQLPDGGHEVETACNSGTPLWKAAATNPLRKGILDLCEALAPKIDRRRQTETGAV